jgi:hypothetical protein
MGTITSGIFSFVVVDGIDVSVGGTAVGVGAGVGVGVTHPTNRSTTSAKPNSNCDSFLLLIVLFLSSRHVSALYLRQMTMRRSGGNAARAALGFRGSSSAAPLTAKTETGISRHSVT